MRREVKSVKKRRDESERRKIKIVRREEERWEWVKKGSEDNEERRQVNRVRREVKRKRVEESAARRVKQSCFPQATSEVSRLLLKAQLTQSFKKHSAQLWSYLPRWLRRYFAETKQYLQPLTYTKKVMLMRPVHATSARRKQNDPE